MWFIAIGGMERTLKKLIGSIVAPYTEKAFINAVLGGLFMMKKNRDPDDEDDADDPSTPYKPKKIHKRAKPEFVSKQEEIDYKALLVDIKGVDNKQVGPKSIKNIVTHLFKNR